MYKPGEKEENKIMGQCNLIVRRTRMFTVVKLNFGLSRMRTQTGTRKVEDVRLLDYQLLSVQSLP